jgi:hypothetical protein
MAYWRGMIFKIARHEEVENGCFQRRNPGCSFMQGNGRLNKEMH